MPIHNSPSITPLRTVIPTPLDRQEVEAAVGSETTTARGWAPAAAPAARAVPAQTTPRPIQELVARYHATVDQRDQLRAPYQAALDALKAYDERMGPDARSTPERAELANAVTARMVPLRNFSAAVGGLERMIVESDPTLVSLEKKRASLQSERETFRHLSTVAHSLATRTRELATPVGDLDHQQLEAAVRSDLAALGQASRESAEMRAALGLFPIATLPAELSQVGAELSPAALQKASGAVVELLRDADDDLGGRLRVLEQQATCQRAIVFARAPGAR